MTSRISWMLGWLALKSSTIFCSTGSCSGSVPVPRPTNQRIWILFGSALTAFGSTITIGVGEGSGAVVGASATPVGASAAAVVGATAVGAGAVVGAVALVASGAGAPVGLVAGAGAPPQAASANPNTISRASKRAGTCFIGPSYRTEP